MSISFFREVGVRLLLLIGGAACIPMVAFAQSSQPTMANSPLADTPSIIVPSHLSNTVSAQQRKALQSVTPEQIQRIQTMFTPRMQKIVQDHISQQAATGSFRSWRDIISKGTPSNANANIADAQVTNGAGGELNSSAVGG